MKIAIFHELNKFSGARKAVNEYGKILSKQNTVDLYFVDEGKDNDIKGLFSNIYFFQFKEKKWKGNNFKIKLYKDTLELLNLYFLHRKIAKTINSKKYDFVLINPSKFTQAPFLLRFVKNSVYFCQEPLRIVYDDLYKISKIKNLKDIYEVINRKFRKEIDRENIENAKLVLANSNFSKNNIRKAYDLDSLVCYLGVDEKLYSPTYSKKNYDIFFTGEKDWVEGYDLFVKTLKLYSKKPKVLYAGRQGNKGLSEKEMAHQYMKAKIAVSLSRSEPFGLNPIEAMACGIPVVAVNEGALRETVKDGKTGYLINRDPLELKEKIDLLLKDDKLRKNLGSLARDHILNRFTWKKSVSNFLQIIKYD